MCYTLHSTHQVKNNNVLLIKYKVHLTSIIYKFTMLIYSKFLYEVIYLNDVMIFKNLLTGF